MWRGGGLREVRSGRPSSASPGDGLGASARLDPALALRLDCNALLLQPHKTHEPRVISVSSDLRAVLEMRRTDPTGDEFSPDAYVFGNAMGERRVTIKTAWRNTCRRAGIHDLHFHDLRREFACRLLESSADLHDVRDFLGHANITTTSRYLRSAPVRLAEALQRMEAATVTVADADEQPYLADMH